MPIDVSRSLFIKNDAGEFVPVPMLKGEPGPAGPQGEPGSDANVTFENITNALGYVAADDEFVQETADKLDMLWKLSEGQIYDYVQHEESGMNAAPKGTFAQYVDEVYGKSEQETEADRITDLEEAISLLAEVMFGG